MMFVEIRWVDPEHRTGFAKREGGGADIVIDADASPLLWSQALNNELGPTIPYQPPPPPPPPSQADVRLAMPTLTRRQVLIGLRRDGLLTDSEALAAAQTGAVPAIMAVPLSQLPQDARTDYEIEWATFSQADRLSPFVELLRAAHVPPLSDTDVDSFFTRHQSI